MRSAFLFLILFGSASAQPVRPIDVVQRVADKLIRETSFEFALTIQKRNSLLHSIDWDGFSGSELGAIYYATSTLTVANDTAVTLGVSHAGPFALFVNGGRVYSNGSSTEDVRETAYEMFRFPSVLPVKLSAGMNTVLIKTLRTSKDRSVMLGFIDSAGFLKEPVPFSIRPYMKMKNDSIERSWLLIGPFTQMKSSDLFKEQFPPETGFKALYQFSDRTFIWEVPKERTELSAVISNEASFKQHSYFEWHYANGQTALAMIALGDAAKDATYTRFVSRYCTVTTEMDKYFSRQFHSGRNRNGFNYRLYRLSMLDDSSAPVLPFIELALRDSLKNVRPLIDSIARFVSLGQARLKDGTLCRMEPEPNTVWADDLFMSVPFLLRYAKLSGNKAYNDDAVRQIKNFHSHLYNKESGICSHGWFDDRSMKSPIAWGRANGWMIWAVSEALLYLPKDHQGYKEVMEIYRQRIKGIMKYQNAGGMWYQILDDPSSYEETSCSAMFVLSIARGMTNGWLEKKYRSSAERGWEGIQQRIAEDGTVGGICQGTGIGDSKEFYMKRKTPKHDPRGLGAVITAGIEMQNMLSQ